MLLSLVVLGFIFIIGLVVGSFLNVVILRTVSEESIVFPGSKCPKCQNPLKWYHNIPLLSYLFLKGKCAYCKEHISLQYPIVEFITGCIFVWLFIRFCVPFDPLFGLSVLNPISWVQIINYIFVVVVSCLFIIIAGTDIKEMMVYNLHTYLLIGSGVIYSILMAILNIIFYTRELGAPNITFNLFLSCPILFSIGAGIVAFGVMEILRRGSSYILKKDGFGDGDSYIAAGIGSVIGALFGNFPLYSSFSSIMLVLGMVFIISAILPVVVLLPLYIKRLVLEKNWFILSGLFVFVLYAGTYLYAREAGWMDNLYIMCASSLVLMLLAFFVCSEILKGIKTQKSDGYPIPYGPSLVVAAFIVMVYLPLM